jgi:hypothetical protein
MCPLIVHASSKAESDLPRRVLHIEYARSLDCGDGLKLRLAGSLSGRQASGHHLIAKVTRSDSGAVKVSRSLTATALQDGHRHARAARSARSERSEEPCTTPRRARKLPDVMAVCVNPGHDIENVLERCRFLRWIRRMPDEEDCMRASSDIDTAGRERPPQRGASGPHRPRDTGVVHVPVSVRHPGALTGGRHTAPSAPDDIDARNLMPRGILPPGRSRRASVRVRCQRAERPKRWGTSSLPALVPPPLRAYRRNQRRRQRLHRPLRTAPTAEHVGGVAGAIDGNEAARNVRFRRRRPGGRGEGIASG